MILLVIVSTGCACVCVTLGHWLGRTGVNTAPVLPHPVSELDRRRAAREMAMNRHPAGKGWIS